MDVCKGLVTILQRAGVAQAHKLRGCHFGLCKDLLKGGRTKDEALRLAQIDLIRSADYAQPRDWAAFELMGDWR